MARRAHHSTHHSPKHNTTRSGSTKDTRPAAAQKDMNAALDPTGGQNPTATLSSAQDRGQTLGSGPWNHQHSMAPGSNIEPWSA
jgi:hypothetical protein